MKSVRDEFNVYTNILKYLLYWPIETSNFYHKIAYIIIFFIKLSLTILYFFIQCLTVYKTSKSMAEVMDSSFIAFTLWNYFVKAFRYTYCNGRLRKLLDSIEDDIFQPKSEKTKNLLLRAMGNWKFIFRFYMVVCVTAVSLWGISALISDDERALPLGYWYPFDVKRSPAYEIVFCYEIFGMIMMSVTHVTMDSMMVSFLAFITGHLDILNESLRSLNGPERTDDNITLKEQVRCIVLYMNIKSMVQEINAIIVFPMFIQSTLGAIILCTAMYKLTKVELFSGEGLSYINYYVAMITQLSIQFWYGNEIIWKSNQLSKSAYQCNWIDQTKSFNSNLLTFMVSTIMPIEVSGGYFTMMSLEPLITILKCSWSYSAVLRSM